MELAVTTARQMVSATAQRTASFHERSMSQLRKQGKDNNQLTNT